ncbi:MAG: NAD(P)H-hydrate dehydratase, partial [Candidatus Diapherotrites archaeon CG08_land_8_20_14_0_20_34_12]
GSAVFAAKTASLFCDLIYVLSVKENIPILKKASPEFIVSETNLKNAKKFAEKADSILIGPGLEANSKNKKLLNFLLKNFKHKKFILDASALYLADKKLLSKNCAITPHAAEFKKMFKAEATAENAKKFAKKYSCIVALKSGINVISDGKLIYHNVTGNAGMTTGGTGDVLAGLIAAFACKNELLHASLAAIFLNGFAGDILKAQRGYAFNAENLMQMLPFAKKFCEDNY